MANRNPRTNLNRSERRNARINRARELEAGVTSLTDQLLPRNTEDSAQLVTADRLLPSRVYEGLQSGPNFSKTYETQIGRPIDGGRGISRDSRFGSPFTFRVLPNQTLVNSLLEREDSSGVNIIGAAQRADSTFTDYTNKLDRLRTGNPLSQSTVNTIENFIAEGIRIDKNNINDPENRIPAVADTRAQADVLLQLLQMLNTPPLTLLINPQTLSISHQKKQTYNERSRTNYIFQSWGEEQVRLSVTGKTGAFLTGDPPSQFHVVRGASANQVVQTATATGVQFASKRDSASFQNLMNLLLFYRNNGYIYDRIGQSEAHLWIGSIAIDYDQFTYVGNFESFEYSYVPEQMNGGINFSFEFTASRIYDNAQRTSVVEPIESPVPSPSDSQWSVPGPRRRRSRSRDLLGSLESTRNASEKPTPTSEGITSPAVNSLSTGPGTSRPVGLVRGGDF